MIMICDIGGTKMRLSHSINVGFFSDPNTSKTPDDFNDGVKILQEYIDKIKPKKIVIGIAGSLNQDKTSLVAAPNLKNWEGKNIKESLKTDADIFIENDTALVGLGEATVGAGKNYHIVAYITVSTGVGGVRIVDKKIDINRHGFEPGHQIVDLDNTACGPDCENIEHHGIGHLDNLVSGKALEQKTGKKATEITDSKIWNEHADHLAAGLYNTIVHWSPDVVVLGGSMIVGDPAIPFDRIVKKTEELMHTFPILPEIKKALLKDVGGLHGALYYGEHLV